MLLQAEVPEECRRGKHDKRNVGFGAGCIAVGSFVLVSSEKMCAEQQQHLLAGGALGEVHAPHVEHVIPQPAQHTAHSLTRSQVPSPGKPCVLNSLD
eukprot:2319704-Rhodomonas_salina.1